MISWISPDYPYKIVQVKGTSGGAKDKLEYLCEAEPATLTSSSYWRIRKFTYDSAGFMTGVSWADGERSFTKVADNYSTYTYS